MATITPVVGSIGQKTDRNNLLTYALTGTMSTITEKVNGVTIGTKTATSGQSLTVALTQAQWDAVAFGKYAYRNLVPSFDSGLWVKNGSGTGTVNSPSKLTLVAASGGEFYNIKISVKPNTNYILSVKHNGMIAIYNGSLSFPLAGAEYTTSQSVNFNSGSETSINIVLGNSGLGTGTFTFENVMLNEGTTAKPFVPLGAGNTLTIEMGTEVFTYTFDKRLATGADLLSAVKAVQDADSVAIPAKKALLASAIRAKGGNVSDADAFEVMASAVGGLSNAKIAKGSFSASNGATTTINNLTFTPDYVLVKISGTLTTLTHFSYIDNKGYLIGIDRILETDSSTTGNVSRVSNVSNGFKHTAYATGTFNFIAIKE